MLERTVCAKQFSQTRLHVLRCQYPRQPNRQTFAGKFIGQIEHSKWTHIVRMIDLTTHFAVTDSTKQFCAKFGISSEYAATVC
jgi:hypothetical protein